MNPNDINHAVINPLAKGAESERTRIIGDKDTVTQRIMEWNENNPGAAVSVVTSIMHPETAKPYSFVGFAGIPETHEIIATLSNAILNNLTPSPIEIFHGNDLLDVWTKIVKHSDFILFGER